MNTSTNTADTKQDRQRALDHHRQTQHPACVVCDPANPFSLNLNCKADDHGGVSSRFEPKPWMAGFTGQLHGGIVSALLDGAMTQCLFAQNTKAVTAVLHTRFRKPVPIDQALQVRAWLKDTDGKRHQLKAELHLNDALLADAEATFLSIED